MENAISQVFRAIDGCSLAALRTFATRGSAAARVVLGATLTAANPRKVPALTSLDIVRAFPVEEAPTIYTGHWTAGCTAPLERFLLAQLLRHFRPQVIVEIGTYRGESTRLILDNCSDSARIVTVDLPPQTTSESVRAATDAVLIENRVVGEAFINHPRAAQVTQVFGDTFDPTTWKHVPEGVEFAFIDASHSYAAVRNDTESVWPKLTRDAVVVWHDYTEGATSERGVGQYIRERMLRENDIFICPETSMAFRIPLSILTPALKRIPSWYPAGDFALHHPLGVATWLQS